VLVPIDAADLLMRLAVEDCYRPLWSQAVLDELRRTVLKVHPGIGDAKIERRIDQMNATFEDALVTGWEALVPGIEIPHPDDRPIVAAAVRGRADLIVTGTDPRTNTDVLRTPVARVLRGRLIS